MFVASLSCLFHSSVFLSLTLYLPPTLFVDSLFPICLSIFVVQPFPSFYSFSRHPHCAPSMQCPPDNLTVPLPHCIPIPMLVLLFWSNSQSPVWSMILQQGTAHGRLNTNSRLIIRGVPIKHWMAGRRKWERMWKGVGVGERRGKGGNWRKARREGSRRKRATFTSSSTPTVFSSSAQSSQPRPRYSIFQQRHCKKIIRKCDFQPR